MRKPIRLSKEKEITPPIAKTSKPMIKQSTQISPTFLKVFIAILLEKSVRK